MDTDLILPSSAMDISLFLNPPSETLSKTTKEAYQADRAAYLEFCSKNALALGDTASLEAYRDFLESASLKPSTINRKLCGIKKGLVGYLVAVGGKDKEEVARHLYKSVHQIKISKGEKTVRPEAILSEEDIQKLMKGADKRTALIIKFLASTGCRVSEMIGIGVNDVKVKDSAVEVSVMGKGRKARTVLISKADYEAIQTTFKGTTMLFETIHRNPYNRTNITKSLGNISKRALGKHVYAHLLRHSFATNMIRKTRKVQAVSEYLGHSDVAITLSMYTHESLTLGELQVG
jgi:site-specific recombinase XerD